MEEKRAMTNEENRIGCQPKNRPKERSDCMSCGYKYDDENCLNYRLKEQFEIIYEDSLYKNMPLFLKNMK